MATIGKGIAGGAFRRHWFFDLDGTLARTGEDIVSAWKRSIADIGRECPRFDEVFSIGPTLEEVVYALFDDASPGLVAQLVERFRENYDESGFPETVPYPGVVEGLASLKSSGARMYIVTNKRHAPTCRLAEKFGWNAVFDGIWSFDSIPGRRFAKPDLLAHLLRTMSIDPSDAVMVGDTGGDVAAGKANGMHTVGVTWGYGSIEGIAGADETVGRFV